MHAIPAVDSAGPVSDSAGPVVVETLLSVAFGGGAIEFYDGLDPAFQAVVALSGTFVVGLVVLGILPGYSTRVVKTARRSPVISTCFGIPGTLTLSAFLYIGYLIADTSLGVFFAIPLVSVGVTLLPAMGALGLVAIGGTIASRLGFGQVLVGLLVGSILVGIGSYVPIVAVVVGALASFLGVGAGIRVLFGSGVAATYEERAVPPSNKV